ncbi:hypothetical protein MVEN_01003100 [Mycena venus]|uniref:Uncharacterized protein n=1 Tax=Mycena venus TaxID=2733690 RepID=A0A8H6Y969_9AGAR|nr:hypothetical protein MVEN_01003100 [Mycena venus]
MATVMLLVREYYIPQFVLGGLTGAFVPVIFRHAATVPTAVPKSLEELPNMHDEPDIHGDLPNIPTPPTALLDIQPVLLPVSFHLPFAKIQAICPVKHEIPVSLPMCFPVWPIHMCAVEPIPPIQPLDSAASFIVPSVTAFKTISSTLDSIPTSADFPPSVPITQIIGSYLLSPPVILQLAGLCFVFLFVTSMCRLGWRSVRAVHNNAGDNSNKPPRHSARIRKLQRKPSDAPNWRIARNYSLQSEAIPPPPVQSETIPNCPLRPLRQRSITSPTIPHPIIAAHTTQPTTSATVPPVAPLVFSPIAFPVVPPAAPTYATYVPPHRRASFDYGVRRPLGDVGNGGARDRAWQAKASFQTDHKRRLFTQIPLSTPVLQSEHGFHRLHHRASFPKDMRRYVKANTNESANRFVHEGRRENEAPKN